MPHGVVDAAVKEGANTWFFITADYAFGHSLQKDAASFVTGAGGKVLGQALAPFPGTTDFSSFLVQAQASGAKVVGLANGGADTVNCIKQAAEFGIMKGGQKVAGLIFLIHDVHGVGLVVSTRRAADRTVLLEPQRGHARILQALRRALQWRGPRLRACRPVFRRHALSENRGRDRSRQGDGERARRNRAHEGNADQRSIVRRGKVRTDGRVIHNMYLFEVKSPARIERTVGLLHLAPDHSG